MSTSEVTTVIRNKQVFGPFDGKRGQYYKQVLETDHGQFSGLVNTLEDTSGYDVGDKVFLYTVKSGNFINIVKVQRVEGSGIDVTNTVATGKGTTANIKTTTGYNSQGARLGAVFHDAVALTTHNKAGSTVTITQVKETAKGLLQAMKEVEQEELSNE